MGNRRFSATTYVLVGLSLVALYFVGTKVTPPPPPPPQEVAPAAAVTSAAPQKATPETSAQVAQHEKVEKQAAHTRAEVVKKMLDEQKKHPVPPTTKKFNPMQVDTESTYWQQAEDGSKGAQEMRAKVAQAEAEAKNAPPVPTRKVLPPPLKPEMPTANPTPPPAASATPK